MKNFLFRHMVFALTFILSVAFSLPAFAAPEGRPHEAALQAVESHVQQQLQNPPGKVRVRAGPLDPRLRLSPCEQYQPYLPNGTRLLGNVNVGLRCLTPARWNIFVPVKISIESHYVVAATPLAAGQSIQPHDLLLISGDLGTLPAGVLNDPAQAIGKTLRAALAAGQPLRQEQLVAPLVIRQGQTVRLVVSGPGFTASNEGRALNNAAEGQVVQVRTLSNTVVSGIAAADGTVQVGGSAGAN
jgi:flagella basal body P-ring formation protein FlgA